MLRLISLVLFGVYLIGNLNQVHCQYSEEDTSGCVFPFKYNGVSLKSCTRYPKDFEWCSYTKDFNGVWKYCNDRRKTDWKCVGPCENYNGEKYPSCESDKNKRIYCTDEIKYITDSDSSATTDDCAEKFKEIPFHTYCLATSKYVAKEGLSKEDQKAIVDLHNKYRMSQKTPAANMMKLKWDDELALGAQKHASRCSFDHDSAQLRSIPGKGKNTGQNIVKFKGSKDYNITYAFESMYEAEKIRWVYGEGLLEKFRQYGQHSGHYTQILLEHLSKMGCGYAECVYADIREMIYVCNYDNLQFSHEMAKPYAEGEWCSGCKDSCVDGKLCDCDGLECLNGGKLDKNSCTCSCHGWFEGKSCENKIESVVQSNGCSIPYMNYEYKLEYGCIKDPDDYYDFPVCANGPMLTWTTMIECKAESKRFIDI